MTTAIVYCSQHHGNTKKLLDAIKAAAPSVNLIDVIKTPDTDLCHPIRKPAEYPLHSLRECVKAAETLNQNDENIEHEGFVVVDADWHRIKVKSLEYVYAHRVASCHVFTKKRILPMTRINDGSPEELIKTAPDSEVYVRYYQWRYAELKKAVGIAISKARAMYEELEHDRKAIASYLKDEQLQTFCFKALGNNLTAAEILADMSESMIGRLIEDYRP